jgi:hypothetical protein
MALLQKAYLGSTPLFRNEDWFEQSSYTLVNASAEVSITANTSAHTKGSYSELIASTSANTGLLVLMVQDIAVVSTNTATLIDIATGASGSETDIIGNLAVGGAVTTAGPTGVAVSIPFQIPSGTRLSARIQSVVTGGKTATAQVFLFDVGGDYATAPTSVDVITGDTATSEGISFSGSSGTWVQAIASTSRAYRAVAIVPSTHNSSISAFSPQFEVGVGSSGSEQTFGVTIVNYNANEFVQSSPPYLSLFGRNIPSGSRLAVKHNIGANPNRYGFTLIGIP